jgi:hypothetical protein
VVGDERQAGRLGITVGGQQVDDRGMDLPAARRAQRRRREVPHLFMREAEVSRSSGRALDEQPGGDCRHERLGERGGIRLGPLECGLHSLEIAQAERTPEHRRLGEERAGRSG